MSEDKVEKCKKSLSDDQLKQLAEVASDHISELISPGYAKFVKELKCKKK